MKGSSRVVDRFSELGQLTAYEKELIQLLERDPKHYPAGTQMGKAGQRASFFFVLRSGWAYSSRVLAEGQRQVVDIFLPGQIVGLRDITFAWAQSDLYACTDVEACPFPRQRVAEVFLDSPHLADLLFLLLAREEAMLIERIINIGRRPAAQRLAHFILEMKVRLKQTGNEFGLPLSQAIIGDALGLSAVHVSRTLKDLRGANLVNLADGKVTIIELDKLKAFAEFSPSYLDARADWVSTVLDRKTNTERMTLT